MKAVQDSPALRANLEKAERFLRHFRDDVTVHFIGGAPRRGSSGRTFENLTPIDNTSLGRVAEGTADDVDAAARAAAAAFPSWRDTPGKDRQRILNRFADVILERAEEVALVESMDTGQPIRFMKAAALRGAENFRFFADKAPAARDGLSLLQEEHLNYTLRTPIGPVGVITPWNTPFMLSTWKIAPAICYGNTVVFKPADLVPGCSWAIVDILHRAGLPKGVMNLVMGKGSVVGQAILDSKDVSAITFTGGVGTGKRVAEASLKFMRKVQLEMGGKNPTIVLDDADLKVAVESVTQSAFFSTGQRCTASSRVIVTEGIHDKFVEALSERVRNLKVGDAMEKGVEIGPVVDPGQLKQDLDYIEVGKNEGAKLVAGGEQPRLNTPGYYLQPALFTEANNQMRISREEIFGPVAAVIRVKDYEEALATANDTEFGLSAGIVTYPHPAVSQADDLFALVEAALARGKAQSGERVGIAD